MRDRSWRLHGLITALASPFRDGRLDEERLTVMAARQVARGTTALVASGSTGEASMLSISEHVRLIRMVAAVSAGCVPVIAGCTATATEVSRFLAVAAARAGADAVMMAPLHTALFLESNPIPLKAALAAIRLCAETVRAPLTPALEATRAALSRALAKVMTEEDAVARLQSAAPMMRMAG